MWSGGRFLLGLDVLAAFEPGYTAWVGMSQLCEHYRVCSYVAIQPQRTQRKAPKGGGLSQPKIAPFLSAGRGGVWHDG